MTFRNNINLHILNASGKLTLYIKQIENIFEETISKILKIVSVSSIDVVVYEYANGIIPELGVGGDAYDPYVVRIYLDSKFPDFLNKTLKIELRRTIAHELSHAIRRQAIGYGTNLLQALISEGLADHFDREINNVGPNLWDVIMGKDRINEMLKKAKREYNSKNYDHYAWFFGTRRIPRWTGYALGYNLVAEYLKRNPSRKPSELHKLQAKEFIK